MKRLFIGFSLLTCTVASVFAQTTQTKTAAVKKTTTTSLSKKSAVGLKSSIDSFSYAVGVNVARNLKMQEISGYSTEIIKKAMDDILSGAEPALTEQQEGAIIQKRLQESSMKKAAEEKAEAEKTQKAGAAFLAENGKRPGVITLPDGLQYEVIKKADSVSESPKLEDTVVANYVGTLINGKEFDNSYKRGTPITIGVNNVIKGWTEILQMMHVGDKWKVYIPSELGYGEKGVGQGAIPGGSTLIFEMELLGVKKAIKHDDKK